ncbi:MAG: HNH endonuclease signature motif containing protein, partial [Candidatus Omnitrophica bacterium]|nr:HNH endonuclease signature motif containing protein [Candidatus Omnitrophota bacterium]
MEKYCPICNNVFEAERKTTKYCSRECYWKSKKGKEPWNKGVKGKQIPWNKGIKTGTSKLKNRKRPDLTGKNNGNWIEDRTKLAQKQERNDSRYQDWRKQILKRDNYQCKICGLKMTKEHKLVVHHILPWIDYPEERYNINNGIT